MPTPSHRFNPKSWSLNQIRKAQFVCMLLAALVSLPAVFFPDSWALRHLLCMVALVILVGIDITLNKVISRGPNGIFSMGANDASDDRTDCRMRDESALTHENQANAMAILILFCVLICIAMINQYALDGRLRFTVYFLFFIASLMVSLQLGCYLYLEHRDMTRSETAADAEA